MRVLDLQVIEERHISRLRADVLDFVPRYILAAKKSKVGNFFGESSTNVQPREELDEILDYRASWLRIAILDVVDRACPTGCCLSQSQARADHPEEGGCYWNRVPIAWALPGLPSFHERQHVALLVSTPEYQRGRHGDYVVAVDRDLPVRLCFGHATVRRSREDWPHKRHDAEPGKEHLDLTG